MLNFFYADVPVAGPPIAAGQGLVVALVYRLITLLIAALGVFYYFGNRREMAEVIHEAEAGVKCVPIQRPNPSVSNAEHCHCAVLTACGLARTQHIRPLA